MSSTINLQNVLSNIIRPIYVYDPATSNYVVKVILSNVETYSGNSFNVGSLTFGDANYNLYIGSNAGSLDPFSSNNIAIGYGAAEDDSNVQNSVFIGYLAGGANILDASATVAIGSETLAGGSSNVYIGYGTGSASSNSSGNVFLGPMIAPGGVVSNQVRIGSGSTVPIFANLATGRVGINTTTPGYALDVAGATANIQGDLQVAGTLTAANFAPTTLKVPGVSSTLNPSQISAIEVGEGDTATGPTGFSSISFQYNGGGFRHLLRTRHNNAVNSTGNAVDFLINNSATATGSTQPNSGNKLALAITGAGVGVGGILLPSYDLDVSGTTQTSNVLVPGFLRDALTPVTLDISGGNISNSGTTQSSNFIGNAAASNSIGGITLSNGTLIANNIIGGTGTTSFSNIIVPGYIRDAVTASTLDISGGNISNSGTTRSSNFIGTTTASNSIGGVILSNSNAIVSGFLRNALTPTQFDISGGNISNSGTHTTYTTITRNLYAPTTSDVSLISYINMGTGENGASGGSTNLQFLWLRGGGTPFRYSGINYGSYNTSSFLTYNTQTALVTKYVAGLPTNQAQLDACQNLLTLTNTGRLGIFTNSPATTLDVSGAVRVLRDGSSSLTSYGLNNGTDTLILQHTGAYTTTADIGKSASILFANSTSNYPQARIVSEMTSVTPSTFGANLIFQTNNAGTSLAERMRIHSNGNVGIATTAPAQTLDVSGVLQVSRGAGALFDVTPTGNYAGVTMNGYFTMYTPGTTNKAASNLAVSIAPETGSSNFFRFNNTGFGTTSPQYAVDISSSGTVGAMIRNNSGQASLRLAGNGFQDASALQIYHNSSDQGLYNQNALPFYIWMNNVRRVAITTGGNVGIGTTTPLGSLDVPSGSVVVNRIGNVTALTDVSMIVEGSSNVGMYLQKGTNNNFGGLSFKTASNAILSERMRIDANTGSIGIGGITAPAYTLDISAGNTTNTMRVSAQLVPSVLLQGNGTDASFGALVFDARAASTRLIMRADGGVPLTFETPKDTERMRISTAGNVGIGTTAPAYRLDVTSSAATTAAINMSTWPRSSISNVLIVKGYSNTIAGVGINWTTSNIVGPNTNLISWTPSNVTSGCFFSILKSGIWSITYTVLQNASTNLTWIDGSTNSGSTTTYDTVGSPPLAIGGPGATNAMLNWIGYLPSNASYFYKLKSSGNLATPNNPRYLQIAFLGESDSTITYPF